ncbi:MAG: hypothetical protein Q4D02_03180 [Clostridia bacterium]|nr:hypothetical protein [Clostridia bacterium]
MKKNIALLFLILLFVAAAVSTIFLFSKNLEKTKEIENLNAKIETLQEENLANIPKEEKGILPVFDVNKIVNKKDDMIISLNSVSKSGLVAKLNENGEVMVQVIDSMYFENFSGELNQYQKVEGVSGKVVDVNIFNQGNGINPQIIMLIEDGTVEYVNMKELKQGNMISAGKVEGLKDIVKIVEVAISVKPVGGYFTIAGVQSDGSSILFPELVSSREE